MPPADAGGGIAVALALSFVNALGDPIRKRAGRTCRSGTLFAAARGVFSAPTAIGYMILSGHGSLGELAELGDPSPCFALTVAGNALINAAVSLLMNRALQLSDIGVAVPFLSFTPAFLLVLAPLFLGEVPTAAGFAGVLLITAGAFVLADTQRAPPRGLPLFAPPAKGPASVGGPGGGSGLPRAWRGPLFMLCVAALWSVSSTIDKAGVRCAPSAFAYGAAVQLLHPLLCAALHAGVERHMPHAAGAERPVPWRLVALGGLAAGGAHALHVRAVSLLPVTYVIAIKRAGCVFSVLLGRALLGERRHFAQRLAAVAAMVLGVFLIMRGG